MWGVVGNTVLLIVFPEFVFTLLNIRRNQHSTRAAIFLFYISIIPKRFFCHSCQEFFNFKTSLFQFLLNVLLGFIDVVLLPSLYVEFAASTLKRSSLEKTQRPNVLPSNNGARHE
jgi:hypothetical protein